MIGDWSYCREVSVLSLELHYPTEKCINKLIKTGTAYLHFKPEFPVPWILSSSGFPLNNYLTLLTSRIIMWLYSSIMLLVSLTTKLIFKGSPNLCWSYSRKDGAVPKNCQKTVKKLSEQHIFIKLIITYYIIYIYKLYQLNKKILNK